MANPELFEFGFSHWLEANGVVIADLIGNSSQPAADMRFAATVDLTALGQGIAEVVIHHGGRFDASAAIAAALGARE